MTIIENHEPLTFYPLQKANEFVTVLRLHEEDGWTYKVITVPTNGLAYIAVYDEAGAFLGPL